MSGILNIFKKRTYESSIYYIRELAEPPERDDDLPYTLIRLHDMYVEKRGIKQVLEHAKNFIRNASEHKDDGVWLGVLQKYSIPFETLQWGCVIEFDNDKKCASISIRSHVFYHNELECQLKIRVFCSYEEGFAFCVMNKRLFAGGVKWGA